MFQCIPETNLFLDSVSMQTQLDKLGVYQQKKSLIIVLIIMLANSEKKISQGLSFSKLVSDGKIKSGQKVVR